jgi:hypothetical protein
MESKMDKKIELLYTAISDAQEIIRFIDTKTALVITILAAYIFAFFSSLDTIIKYSSDYSFYFWLFFSTFLVFFILCVVVTARIIKPTFNPASSIINQHEKSNTLEFFLYPNDYSKGFCYPFMNSKKFVLNVNYKDYTENLIKSTENDIVSALTFELFKVSYIRNLKNDRFNILVVLLVLLTISFFMSFLLYSLETNHIRTFYEEISKHCRFCR